MLRKIPKQHRREFLLNLFLYMPSGIIVGTFMAAMVAKFVGVEIDLGVVAFSFSFVVLACIYSIWTHYRRLTKNNK
jgi:hypothetical protein